MMTTQFPESKHFIDFSDPDDNAKNRPYTLHNGAEVKGGAPGNVGKALRIKSDGAFARLENVNINPDIMPECTLAITFYLKTIPEGSRGWILNHDNGGFDRCLALHDERFKGIGHGVGNKRGGSVYNEYTVPPIGQWIQMVLTYRHGEECAVFVRNDRDEAPKKAPNTAIGNNNKGKKDLIIGCVESKTNHWCNCWVKDVAVYDVALSDDQVAEMFKKPRENKRKIDDSLPPSHETGGDSINISVENTGSPKPPQENSDEDTSPENPTDPKPPPPPDEESDEDDSPPNPDEESDEVAKTKPDLQQGILALLGLVVAILSTAALFSPGFISIDPDRWGYDYGTGILSDEYYGNENTKNIQIIARASAVLAMIMSLIAAVGAILPYLAYCGKKDEWNEKNMPMLLKISHVAFTLAGVSQGLSLMFIIEHPICSELDSGCDFGSGGLFASVVTLLSAFSTLVAGL